MIKINNCPGALTDMTAKKEALIVSCVTHLLWLGNCNPSTPFEPVVAPSNVHLAPLQWRSCQLPSQPQTKKSGRTEQLHPSYVPPPYLPSPPCSTSAKQAKQMLRVSSTSATQVRQKLWSSQRAVNKWNKEPTEIDANRVPLMHLLKQANTTVWKCRLMGKAWQPAYCFTKPVEKCKLARSTGTK